MDKKDEIRFASLMAKLEAVFFNKIDKSAITLYFDFLDEFSIETIEGAIDSIIRNRERRGFPTIGEIRASIVGSVEAKAMAAWAEVISKIGYEKQFSDSLITKTLQEGFAGVNKFYEGDPRADMADRRHFIEIYKILYLARDVEMEIKKRLEESDIKKLQ
jgi:hypothetical protein